MAISLVSPGIKITEVDQVSSTPSLATTAGGFAGQFRWGPIEAPTLVVSEADLAAQFGTPNATNAVDFMSAANFLAYSQSLYVVRAANTALNATSSNTTSDSANAGTGLLIKNADVYENTSSFDVGPWVAKYAGALGNSLKVSTCATSNAWQSTLSGNVSCTIGSTAVTGSGTTFLTEVVPGDKLILGGRTVQVRTVTSNTALVLETSALAAATAETSVVRRWEFFDLFPAAPGTTPFGAGKLASNDEMHVVVVDQDGEITGVRNNVLEKFASLSKGSDAKGENGGTNYYKDIVNQQSAYVWWADHDNVSSNWGNALAGTTYTGGTLPLNYSMAGGSDGTAIGSADRIAGYAKLADKEAYPLSVVIAGQANAAVVNTIIADLCEERKDCVVTTSPERSDVVNAAGSETANIVDWLASLTRSTYAVVDSGWKYQYNKYSDSYVYVPLNADVAGCMARNDLNREPWLSPAGSVYGRILNATKLAWNPKQADRDTLYKYGVNPVITQASTGTILFGDKTFTTRNTAFNRINVRRLFIELEKTIGASATDILFEQNDATTRTNFVNLITPYLRSVQSRRGITAFKVVCDATNNPESVVNNSEFVCDIFVQPTRSINFIQLNFVAVRGSASFTEVTA
jgi:hypothetical protein